MFYYYRMDIIFLTNKLLLILCNTYAVGQIETPSSIIAITFLGSYCAHKELFQKTSFETVFNEASDS